MLLLMFLRIFIEGRGVHRCKVQKFTTRLRQTASSPCDFVQSPLGLWQGKARLTARYSPPQGG